MSSTDFTFLDFPECSRDRMSPRGQKRRWGPGELSSLMARRSQDSAVGPGDVPRAEPVSEMEIAGPFCLLISPGGCGPVWTSDSWLPCGNKSLWRDCTVT